MEKNSANLTNEWYIDLQMTRELEEFDKLPPTEMHDVRKLWNGCMGPSRTKLQALSVVIDPRVWELERRGTITLDDKLVRRAELAFDEIVNKLVDDNKRVTVNKTWCTLRNARRDEFQTSQENPLDNIFNNSVKVDRAKILGPWKWWSTYAGASHGDFAHDIARVVLNLRCNASATERVNSMYKNVIGIRRYISFPLSPSLSMSLTHTHTLLIVSLCIFLLVSLSRTSFAFIGAG